jgi:hypothetical protein
MRFGVISALILAVWLSAPEAAHAQPPLQRDTWLASGFLGLALDADAVEGELGHVIDMSPGDAELDTSLTTVHATLLYFFDTEYVLTPYVAAGLGIGKHSFDLRTPDISDSHTEFGFNLGAGVTYPLGRATYVRGDFRYFKHIDNVPSVWRFTGGLTVRIGS